MLADLIAAFRQLRRSPMHLVVSTLSLGIGMAIAVAAFSSSMRSPTLMGR